MLLQGNSRSSELDWNRILGWDGTSLGFAFVLAASCAWLPRPPPAFLCYCLYGCLGPCGLNNCIEDFYMVNSSYFILLMTMNLGLWDFVLFYFVFETGSHCVVLVGLELTLWTRMVLNSQICMSLPPHPRAGIKGIHHHIHLIISEMGSHSVVYIPLNSESSSASAS